MERTFSSPPRPLFNAACSAALGIFCCDAFTPALTDCLSACAGAAVFVLFNPARAAVLALVFALAGTAHLWRHHLAPAHLDAMRLKTPQGVPVEVWGEVLDLPRESRSSASKAPKIPQGIFHLRVAGALPAQTLSKDSRLLVFWRGPLPACGDKVWLRGRLEPIASPRNPGEMDAAVFEMRQNVWLQASVGSASEASIIAHGGWCLETWAARTRERLSAQLLRGIDGLPQIHALLVSMVFGVQGNTLKEIRGWFRDSGTLHLFAVSGLNLSMLSGFLMTALRLVKASPRISAVIAAPLLILYALVTGFSASCVRALWASLLWLGVHWTHRPAVALNSLGAAALAILLVDGNALFQISFQLSFCLVLTFHVCTAPASHWLREKLAPDPLLPESLVSPVKQRCHLWGGRGVEVAGAGVLCWCASLPWGVFTFHQVAPIAILTNLVAIPLSFLNLSLAFLSLLSAPLERITPFLNQINASFADGLLTFVKWSATVHGGHWLVGPVGMEAPSLVMFDVGDGGALLLREGESCWMFDCGSDSQATRTVVPGLAFYGISKLEGMALTHNDISHIGGAILLRTAMSPPMIVKPSYKALSKAARSVLQQLIDAQPAGDAQRTVREGLAHDVLAETPTLQCELLFPPPGLHPSMADDTCLVTRWCTPHWKILYTADCGLPAEKWLLENARDQLGADIWIRGTHAREPTGSEEFVNAVHPRIVLVAGSHFRKAAEPLRQWAEKWRARGVAVWLQRDCGAVEAWTGTTNRIRAFVTHETFSFSPDNSQ